MSSSAKSTESQKPICENRRARFDYSIHETFECGLVLTGSEVKSLRLGKANVANAYVGFQGLEAYLHQLQIQAYDKGGYANHEPLRKRKLLLHRKEILLLKEKVETQGCTVIPLKLYFKSGRAKALIAIAKGKKAHDKRQDIKTRDVNKQLRQVLHDRKRPRAN